MILKMYIAKLLVDRYKLDYSEMNTCAEIEEYQRGIARGMYRKHIKKIIRTGCVPKFFVDHVPSRMNEIDFKIEPELTVA